MAALTEAAPDAPQHMTALAQANRVRLARAELKRQVGAGERTAANVISECPWEADSMTVFDLLMAQHRWGRTRTNRFLGSQRISESKTIGSLTERQRGELCKRLDGDAGHLSPVDYLYQLR